MIKKVKAKWAGRDQCSFSQTPPTFKEAEIHSLLTALGEKPVKRKGGSVWGSEQRGGMSL